MSTNDRYSLKWDDFRATFSKSFGSLKEDNVLTDVTLISDDEVYTAAHKVVLSACSTFFQSVFTKTSQTNPILYMGGVTSKHMTYLLDYIYLGEVQILKDDIEDFLSFAKKFHINGLAVNKIKETINNPQKPKPLVILKQEVLDFQEPQSESISTESVSENKGQKAKEEDEAQIPRKVQVNVDADNAKNLTTSENNEPKDKGYIVDNDNGGYRCKFCDYKSKLRIKIKKHAKSHRKRGQQDTESVKDAEDTIKSKKSNVANEIMKILGQLQEHKTEKLLKENDNSKSKEQTKSDDGSSDKIKVGSLEEAHKIINEMMEKTDGAFKCTSCGLESKYKGAIKKHIETHLEGLEYNCQNCDKVFGTRHALATHKHSNHRDAHADDFPKSDENCEEAEIEVTGVKIIENSKEEHGNKTPADLSLSEQKGVEKSKGFEDNPLDKEVGSIKKIKVRSSEEAEITANEMIEKIDGGHKCTSCGYTSKFRSAVKTHIESHLEGLEFKCKICDKVYKTKKSFHAHNSSYHRDIDMDELMKEDQLSDRMEFDENEKGDTDSKKLNTPEVAGEKHEESEVNASEENENNFPDANLGSGKIKVNSIEEAQTVITKMIEKVEGWDRCVSCGYTSKFGSAVKNHIERHHLEGMEYPCKFCDKICRTRSHLNSHKHKAHRDVDIDELLKDGDEKHTDIEMVDTPEDPPNNTEDVIEKDAPEEITVTVDLPKEVDDDDIELSDDDEYMNENQSRVGQGYTKKVRVSSPEHAEELTKELTEKLPEGHRCVACGFTTSSKVKARIYNHIQTHFEGLEFPCTFPSCSKVCRTKAALGIHCSTKHRKGEKV